LAESDVKNNLKLVSIRMKHSKKEYSFNGDKNGLLNGRDDSFKNKEK